ncbi:hypothetical protein HMPREF3229_01784, partial [Peptoniphilus harei]
MERKGWLKKFLKAVAFIIALGLLDKDFIFKKFFVKIGFTIIFTEGVRTFRLVL